MVAAPFSWRALGGAVLLASCSPQIVLGDAESSLPSCVDTGCGGVAQSGSGGLGVAGSLPAAQAGSSSTPLSGSGGSTATAGGESGDGGMAGGQAGASQAGSAPCEPAAVDHVCNGLNEACDPTATDQGCRGTCYGSYVQGTSYMSCLAADDFDAAEARCQANGMHLAKIDSAQENAMVLSLAQDDYVWIGGSNRDDANVYAWLDGTAFYSSGAAVADVYENFGMGEPAQDSKLRCVQLRRVGNGTWSNWQCSGMQSFVCERY